MRNLLNECVNGGDEKKERGGVNFFNDYLEHLFYDTLNNKERGGASVMGDYSWSSYFECRIPYLNGGLFEPIYSWRGTYIDIPNSLFEDLFTTFDRFNFTVYEADALEKDVAVDPEMLGKVFENLLEVDERKGKGAFYTPREIVHYMCQESLINYLTNASGYEEGRVRKMIERKDELTAKTEGERRAIENSTELKEIAQKIDELLRIVTICDPAVGSGAFPWECSKRLFLSGFFSISIL
jgi:adenine-specific DNA-methyltransferase